MCVCVFVEKNGRQNATQQSRSSDRQKAKESEYKAQSKAHWAIGGLDKKKTSGRAKAQRKIDKKKTQSLYESVYIQIHSYKKKTKNNTIWKPTWIRERKQERGQRKEHARRRERASAAACDRGEFRFMRSLVFLSDFPYFPACMPPPPPNSQTARKQLNSTRKQSFYDHKIAHMQTALSPLGLAPHHHHLWLWQPTLSFSRYSFCNFRRLFSCTLSLIFIIFSFEYDST